VTYHRPPVLSAYDIRPRESLQIGLIDPLVHAMPFETKIKKSLLKISGPRRIKQGFLLEVKILN
jgi:hypothetical protein